MKQSKDILDYYGRINASFLHAYGEAGTEKLFQLIKFDKGDSVLEIGFGTGATMIKMASCNKDITVYGIETSEIMFKKADARIRFNGLRDRISLAKVENGQKFPFDDNRFDKIIIESVLAIQDDPSLYFLLGEIRRVLKPSGLFFLNETVWLASITPEEIHRINSYCTNKFGIIQSNGTIRYRDEWKRLLEANRFAVMDLQRLEDIAINNTACHLTLYGFLSRVFTVAGKIRGKMVKELRRQSSVYKQQMKVVFDNKQYLEAIVIIASKDPHRSPFGNFEGVGTT